MAKRSYVAITIVTMVRTFLDAGLAAPKNVHASSIVKTAIGGFQLIFYPIFEWESYSKIGFYLT
jgi:hypothetical protein